MAKQLSTQTVFRNWLKQLCSEQSVRQSSLGASTSTPTSKGQQPVHRLWRIWFVTQHTAQAESGFILPTVTLLLLMVSLIIGLLISRTYSRTAQVIGNRQQTALYNAASPAVDRAKAKIEYLFTQSPLPPLPSDSDINTELANRDSYDLPAVGGASAETRFDINNDGTLDNAWYYSADVDGDNDNETIAYSILTNASATYNSTDYVLESTVNQNKAQSLVVRNGPINLSSSAGSTCQNAQTSPFAGWEPVTSSKLRKAVQVHAVVFDQSNTGMPTSATLEMQQDREANLGNKWGAWFRYDLQLHAGSRFNFNGAMHTEGSFIIRGTDSVNGSAPTDSSYLYLVSSPESCIYTSDASDISMAESDDFQGQFLIGAIADNSVDEDYKLFVDRYVANSFDDTKDRISFTPNQTLAATANKDSVLDNAAGKNLPSEIALNPIRLFTDGISAALTGLEDNTDARDSATNWSDDRPAIGAVDRIVNSETPIPFLDDTYRADNRWGPKPLYTDELSVPSASQYGATITSNTDDLLEQDPMAGNPLDEEGYGYDGYWERRARRTGVRIIVGQRLELGNLDKWSTSDPLYPPQSNAYASSNMADRAHEMRQWKTLRDNLASVQSAAVYHYKSNNGDYPVACLALTAHPGTQVTDTRSRTFNTATLGGSTRVLTDFLGQLNEDADGDGTLDSGEDLNANTRLDIPGNGTNGFEFAPPAGSKSNFETDIASSTSPLRVALKNLAYFAGDPYGGAPSFPLSQDSNDSNNTNDAQSNIGPVVHPYPYMSMWGDFSALRRVIALMEGGTSYTNLSPADKSTLQTASCTLGILAYNIQNAQLQNAALSSTFTTGFFTSNGQTLASLFTITGSINKIYTQSTLPNGSTNPYYDVAKVNLNDGNNATNNEEEILAAWVDPDPNTQIPDLSTSDPSDYICGPGGITDTAGFQEYCDTGEYAAGFTLDQIITGFLLNKGGNAANAHEAAAQLETGLRAIAVGFSLTRDRALGFKDGLLPNVLGTTNGVAWDSTTGYTVETSLRTGASVAFKIGCDPDLFSQLTGGGTGASARDAIVLTLMVCGQKLNIQYPSLYYIFPMRDHDHDGANESSFWDHTQPLTEGYIDNDNNSTTSYYTTAVNTGYTYKVLNDTDSDGFSDSSEDGIGSIAILARTSPTTTWATPITTTSTSTVRNTITINGTDHYPAFLDVGMFDGREQMGIRSLSIDLDLLRRYKYDPTANSGAGGAVANCTLNTPSGDTTDANGQCWLPLPTLLEDNGGNTTSGAIIYAFREDAVREDAIARPTSADTTGFTCDADKTLGTKDDERWLSLWSSYVAATSFTTPTSATRANNALAIDDFLMDAVGATGYFDPPKNPCTGVSPKPVDFYADPDRRPHGFMLTNGSDLRRTDGSNYDTESRGMSFISDNPVYIKGDFNVHYDRNSTDGTTTTLHEEFKGSDLLASNWSNFYTRTNLNAEFADPANDSWRVVEIISDAVTVLSANFEPGFIVEGLLWQTDYSKRNSFGAMRIPRIGSAEPTSNQKASEQTNSTNTSAVGVTKWVLEDGENAVDTFNASGWRAITSPIKIDRSGLPIYNQSTTATEDFVVYGLTSTNKAKANEYLESLTYSNDSHNARSRITAVLAASSSQVSTVLVSGISPSRQNQNYGGLHNFLSLIENWTQNSVNLDFSGSMIQLNFRTYGASFDQDSWEPQNNVSGTANRYYLEPTRNWGYDPALQYAPAGPVARRFVASGNTRSEFYRELSTNDPYVINLRCAYKPGTTTRIDPNVNASLCPF